MEGVFKLKEIFYIYVEVYVFGEFKYGLLVFIDEEMLVIVVVLNNELLEKLKLNVEEVWVWGGIMYVFVDKDVCFVGDEIMCVIDVLYCDVFIVFIVYILLL